MTSAPQNGLPAGGKGRTVSERIGKRGRGGKGPTHPSSASEPRKRRMRGGPERAEGLRKVPSDSGKSREAGRGAGGWRRPGRGAFVPPPQQWWGVGPLAIASPP